ncbi:MAG: 16S rRNA (guanine(966)-N(2))-methyltransferase RsmD [Elusimicrobiota bacterium]
MTMRIIAGSARGRRILSVPKNMKLRPISARIRQSLFDIIRPRVTASHFLDLFAGTGAVGLEALSRNAQRVCFVDRDPRCLRVVEKNIERLGFSDRAVAVRGNVLGALSWIPYRARVKDFDLVFMGPPYRDEDNRPLEYSNTVLTGVAGAKLLARDGWAIVQHHQNENPGEVKGMERFRQERYGDSRVTFYRHRRR